MNSQTSTKITNFKVSTITVTGNINSHINIVEFFNKGRINESIKYMQVACADELLTKGECKQRKKLRKKKAFENQTTLIMQPFADLPSYKVNMKVFKTGAIQITGVKEIPDGEVCINVLIRELQEFGIEVVANPEKMVLSNYKVRLINSDCKANFKINNMCLYKVLEDSDVAASYDPIVYPGVKVMYYCNTDYDCDGVCRCTAKCTGKGFGQGNGSCKKITIIIFQSGSIIITGGIYMYQVERAYEFIVGVLTKSRADIEMKDIGIVVDEVSKGKKKRKGILEWMGIQRS